MAARRWIAGRDMYVCSRCCDGKTCTVKISDAERGTFTSTCKSCGDVETREATSYKERRPCERCREVRDVTVSFYFGDRQSAHAKPYCSICDLEISAASHLATGRTMLARAKKLREEQKAKKQLKKERSTEVLVADKWTGKLPERDNGLDG